MPLQSESSESVEAFFQRFAPNVSTGNISARLSKSPSQIALLSLIPHLPSQELVPLLHRFFSQQRLAETIVLIAPNHLAQGPKLVVSAVDANPNEMPVDVTTAESLRAIGSMQESQDAVRQELTFHALVRILRHFAPHSRFVPVVTYDLSPTAIQRVAEAIDSLVVAHSKNISVIFSCDVGHFSTREQLLSQVNTVQELFFETDPRTLEPRLKQIETDGFFGSSTQVADCCGETLLQLFLRCLHIGRYRPGPFRENVMQQHPNMEDAHAFSAHCCFSFVESISNSVVPPPLSS